MHTVYSEKDGLATSKDYIKKIREYNKKAEEEVITGLACTEHGNMYSLVKHYKACNTNINDDPCDENEPIVKAIYGCEVYAAENRDIDRKAYHLVLLAMDDEGLKNLYQIVTDGGLHNIESKKKRKPVTHEATLKKYGKGVICLSACVGGIIPKLITSGQYEKAKEKALFFKNIFEHFYLEVQPHVFPEQLIVNAEIVRMSKETGIELVITTDSHYVELEDKKYHDIITRIAYGDKFAEERGTCNLHLMLPEEIEEYCIEYEIPLSCMHNTITIADMCTANPKPKDAKGLLPSFSCPEGYSEESYLREIAFDELRKFIIIKNIKDIMKYTKQMMYELDIICTAGFSGYFLILWDWISWCRKNGIPIGKGRGSAAGSIVSYCLGITTVDPIKNHFIFERFLSAERLEYPDRIAC